jgi:hypothetical protein
VRYGYNPPRERRLGLEQDRRSRIDPTASQVAEDGGINLKRNKSAPRPAHAPFKRTLTLALLGPLAMVSLAHAAVLDIESPRRSRGSSSLRPRVRGSSGPLATGPIVATSTSGWTDTSSGSVMATTGKPTAGYRTRAATATSPATGSGVKLIKLSEKGRPSQDGLFYWETGYCGGDRARPGPATRSVDQAVAQLQ